MPVRLTSQEPTVSTSEPSVPTPTFPPPGFVVGPDPAVNGGWRWARKPPPKGWDDWESDGWARDQDACMAQAWRTYHQMIAAPAVRRVAALEKALEEMLLAADKGALRKVHVAAAEVGAWVDYASNGDSVVWK